MVETRAMAAARAAAEAQAATQLVPRQAATSESDEMEDVEEQSLVVAPAVESSSTMPTFVQRVASYEDSTATPLFVRPGPRFEDAIGGLVDDFFDRTAQLAMQNNFTQAQQCNQAAAQNAALMAVKASAESDVQRLAAYQDLVKAEMHGFLEKTREDMRQDILKLVAMQQQTGEDNIHKSLASQIAESFAAAQREALAAQHMAYDQAQRYELVNATIEELRGRLDAVDVAPAQGEATSTARVQAAATQLERGLNEKLQGMVSEAVESASLNGSKGRGVTPQRVKIIANRAVQDAETRLEEKLQRMLAKGAEEAKVVAARRDKMATDMIELAVSNKVTSAKARLEAKLQSRLLKAQEEQSKATELLSDDLQQARVDLTGKIDALTARIDELEEKTKTPITICPIVSPLVKQEASTPLSSPVKRKAVTFQSPEEDATTRKALGRVVTDAVAQLTSLIDSHLKSSSRTSSICSSGSNAAAKKAPAAPKKSTRFARGGSKKLSSAEFLKAVAAKEKELVALRAEVAANRHSSAA